MGVDVLGRRRAVWCSMRRWRCMLLAAADQCVPPPPFFLVVVAVLCVCVCVFGLCVSVCVLHAACCGNLCCSQAINTCSSRCAVNAWRKSTAATSCV